MSSSTIRRVLAKNVKKETYSMQGFVRAGTPWVGGDIKKGDVFSWGSAKALNEDYIKFEKEVWKPIAMRSVMSSNQYGWYITEITQKNELLKTEKELFDIENKSKLDLDASSGKLQKLQTQLNNLINEIGTYIDSDRKLSKEIFEELKQLINKITSSQEEYAIYFGKNETIKSDSIKRKERISNIEKELENWKDIKINSEKMIFELTERRKKLRI